MHRRLLNVGAVIAVVAATLAVAPSLPSSAQTPPPDQRPGQLDKSFNPCKPSASPPCDGKVATAIGGSQLSYGHAMTIDGRGRTIVAGQTGEPFARNTFALARFNSDGSIDESFGDHGTVVAEFGDPEDSSAAFAVIVQPDKRIVAAGCAGCSADREIHFDPYYGKYMRGVFTLARFSEDGKLDTSFGQGGVVKTSFPGLGAAAAYALAWQPKGQRIVAVGSVETDATNFDTGSRLFALSRYHAADGSLDKTFGNQGTQTTAFSDTDFTVPNVQTVDAYSVAIHPDDPDDPNAGKIVAAGGANNTGEFALARYTPDGMLDCLEPVGDCSAKITGHPAGWPGPVRSVMIQRDGKVLLASQGGGFTLFRYRNGQENNLEPDDTFGTGGLITTSFSAEPGDHAAARAAVLQPMPDRTFRILVAGFSAEWLPSQQRYRNSFAAARFHPGGDLDAAFGAGGKLTTGFGDHDSVAAGIGLRLRDSGRAAEQIVVAGWADRPSRRFAISGYTASGQPATRFGVGGLSSVAFPITGFAEINGVVKQAGGKIVAGGGSKAVARYLEDGRLDSTLNPCSAGQRPETDPCGGIAEVAFPVACPQGQAGLRCMEDSSLQDVVTLGDGRIIVAGSVGIDTSPGGFAKAVVARLKSNGDLDERFGDGGVRTVTLPCENSIAVALGLHDDDSIVAVAGGRDCGDPSTSRSYLVRLGPDGALDESFGPNHDGIAPLPELPYASMVEVQRDGNVVVAGSNPFFQSSRDSKFVISRYCGHERATPEGWCSSGSLDKSFGVDGTVTTIFSRQAFLSDVTTHPQSSPLAGSIVAVGTMFEPATHQVPAQVAVAQYTPDGTPDVRFNPCQVPGQIDCGGKLTTDPGPVAGVSSAEGKAGAVEADGKILVLGGGKVGRFTSQGRPDTDCYGFGQGGWSLPVIGDRRMLLQHDGRIVTAGAHYPSSDAVQFGLSRLHSGNTACGFSVADPPIVTEPVSGATPVTFTVTREGDPTLPATVDYTTLGDGSASAGRDYIHGSGRLSFGIGESTKTVTVDVLADPEVEEPEHFLLHLSNPVGAAIVDGTAKAVITNTSPSIAIGDTRVPEPTSGTAPATFTLTMSNPVPYPVAVSYATTNGSATAVSDYKAVSRAVTIPAGATDALVSIDVIGDTDAEGEEDFFVDVGSAEGAVVTKSRGRGVIFEPGPGISIGDTSVTEGNSGITRAAFTVVANRESTKAVTVEYSSADASATVGEDYRRATGAVTLAPGEMGTTVVVEVIADTAHEADETYSLNLGTPLGAALARSSGTGTIINDDPAEPEIPPPLPPGGPPPTALSGIPGSPGPPSLVSPQAPGQVQSPTQAQATSQAPSQAASQATAPSVSNSPATAAQAHSQFAPHVAAQAQAQPQAAMMVERERQAQVETVGMRGGGLAAASLMASARQPGQPGPAPVLALVWAATAMGIGLGVADRRRLRSGALAGVHPVQPRSARRRPGRWRRWAGRPGARSR